MPNVYQFGNCDTPVTPPECDACGPLEGAGVRGVAFIHASVISQIIANPSDSVLWATLRTSGKIFIIPETKGTFDSTPNTIDGYGNNDTVLLDYTHQLEYDDPGYKNNCAFYNTLRGSNRYYVAFISQSTMRISDTPVRVTPTSPIVDDKNQVINWHAIVNWRSKFIPCPVDIPESVFVCEDGTDTPLFPIDTGDGSLLEDGNGNIIEYA